MRQDDEALALALRGGLRGRFQGSFNQLENAFEVLDDYMLQRLNPADYVELRSLMQDVEGHLAYLRRLSDHAADAAAAPILQQLHTPAPLELLGHLRENADLFNELAAGGPRPIRVQLEVAPGLELLPTMGDPALLDSLLVNLFTNSLQAAAGQDEVLITLHCAPGQLLYRDNGPGLPPDALHLLLDGIWSQPLLAQGGLGLPLIRTYCAAMGWQISQPAGETGILFTLPTCQDSGTALRLYSASPEDTRRRRQMFLRELRGLSPESAEP